MMSVMRAEFVDTGQNAAKLALVSTQIVSTTTGRSIRVAEVHTQHTTGKAAKADPEVDARVTKWTQVDDHTDWCSSLTFPTRRTGLFGCVWTQRDQMTLKRCPYNIPTVEELNPEFANASLQ